MANRRKFSTIFNSEDADFELYSSDNLILRVNRIILATASDVFKTMLSIPQPAEDSVKQDGCLPSVDLAESGTTLEILMQFVYPVKSPSSLSFDHYAEVLEAASKYALEGVMDSLRQLLIAPRIDERKLQVKPSLAEQDPLRAYAIATSMGWKTEAVHASSLTLRYNLSTLNNSTHAQTNPSVEVDNMPTKYYRWVNELHDDRKQFFKRLLENFDDEPSEYPMKKCKECTHDPISDWWEEYMIRATASVPNRPLGDKIFDLNFIFPPDDLIEEYGCASCPVPAVPLQTLLALSKLKHKLAKKKDSIRHNLMNPPNPNATSPTHS